MHLRSNKTHPQGLSNQIYFISISGQIRLIEDYYIIFVQKKILQVYVRSINNVGHNNGKLGANPAIIKEIIAGQTFVFLVGLLHQIS